MRSDKNLLSYLYSETISLGSVEKLCCRYILIKFLIYRVGILVRYLIYCVLGGLPPINIRCSIHSLLIKLWYILWYISLGLTQHHFSSVANTEERIIYFSSVLCIIRKCHSPSLKYFYYCFVPSPEKNSWTLVFVLLSFSLLFLKRDFYH